MNARERDLMLFHAKPPRMFPQVEHQRPKIEGMLAQLAAIDPNAYEERLAAYNELVDKHNATVEDKKLAIPHFGRVTVLRETEEVEETPEKTKEEREAELKKLNKTQLEDILTKLGLPLEGTNKQKAEAILAKEFPTTPDASETADGDKTADGTTDAADQNASDAK